MTARRSPILLAIALLTSGLLLSACGGESEADATGIREATGDIAAAAENAGLPPVPEERLAPFPLAVGGVTLDDVELIPADWPAAPDGAVLCGTAGTLDGNQDYAEYAVPLDGDALLAHYEAAFPATYAVERTDTIQGPGLTGTAGEVSFVVEPRDGGMNLVFATG